MELNPPTWENTEPEETYSKNVVFWAKPHTITELDTICGLSHIDRSKVLRVLVGLFLTDQAFRERTLRGANNG